MSRGAARGAPVTRPIIDQLPAIYQDGQFLREFTGGLDDTWAPIIATIDSIHAYIDPWVSPADFVGWLGTWVGVRLDEDWTLDRRREFLARATNLFAKRGTRAGLVEELELYTGGTAYVEDPGGVFTSELPTADGDRRGRVAADRTVKVTVDVPTAADVNWPALQVLVRDAVPAHLPVEIELRETAAPKRRGRRQGSEST